MLILATVIEVDLLNGTIGIRPEDTQLKKKLEVDKNFCGLEIGDEMAILRKPKIVIQASLACANCDAFQRTCPATGGVSDP